MVFQILGPSMLQSRALELTSQVLTHVLQQNIPHSHSSKASLPSRAINTASRSTVLEPNPPNPQGRNNEAIAELRQEQCAGVATVSDPESLRRAAGFKEGDTTRPMGSSFQVGVCKTTQKQQSQRKGRRRQEKIKKWGVKLKTEAESYLVSWKAEGTVLCVLPGKIRGVPFRDLKRLGF